MSELTGNFNLENGDFFVVNDRPQEIENPAGIKVSIMSDLEGAVFEALEVCGEMVAAKVVEREMKPNSKHIVISLNWRRHNVTPVTKGYADAIYNSRKLPRGFDEFEDGMEEFDNSREPGYDREEGP